MNFIDLVKEKATAKQITVYETSDFSIFSFGDTNRQINEKKVNDFMQQDIKDVIYPISATGVILDGQHRIKACERLGKSIKFQIVDNAGADYIHDINTVGSVWGNVDFMTHYARRGIKDYVDLQSFSDVCWKITLDKTFKHLVTKCVVLLYGNINCDKDCRLEGKPKEDFINGKFKINTYPVWIKQTMELYKELNDYIGFVSIRKQTSGRFVTDFYNFSIVLQAWAYQFNYKDVFTDFKKNLLLGIANLPKMVLKCNGDFISVFSDIRNKNRKIRFEYQEFKNTYIQNCTNGKYQKMIDGYFEGLNFGLEEK